MLDKIGEFLFYCAIGCFLLIALSAVGSAIGRVFDSPDDEDL
jgi:hypothetical protein